MTTTEPAELREAMKRYTAQDYRYGHSDRQRIRDAHIIADHACEVLPGLLEACEMAARHIEGQANCGPDDEAVIRFVQTQIEKARPAK